MKRCKLKSLKYEDNFKEKTETDESWKRKENILKN